jgi:hypothetical protein
VGSMGNSRAKGAFSGYAHCFPWHSSGDHVHVSANSMYRHISATHKVDTTSRRVDLSSRISFLRLPLKSSREKMLEHYEQYSTLGAEAISSGVRIDDWEKSGPAVRSYRVQGRDLARRRAV